MKKIDGFGICKDAKPFEEEKITKISGRVFLLKAAKK